MKKQKQLDLVLDIMDRFQITRDCDWALFAKYMNIHFDVHITKEQYEKMKKGPSYASLVRKRRYIQNNLKQYLPSPEVAKSRGQDESKYRDRYGPMYE